MWNLSMLLFGGVLPPVFWRVSLPLYSVGSDGGTQPLETGAERR